MTELEGNATGQEVFVLDEGEKAVTMISVAPLQCELRTLFTSRPTHRALALALAHIGELLGAKYAVLHARIGFVPYTEEWCQSDFELEDTLREEVNTFMLRAAGEGAAHCVRLGLPECTVAVVSAVLFGEGGEQVGHAAFVFSDCDGAHARQLVTQIEALMGFLSVLLTYRGTGAAGQTHPAASAQTLELVNRPMRLLFQVVTDLCNRHGLALAAIGLVRHGRVRVATISGQSDLRESNPSVRAIRFAMEECLDLGAAILYPPLARDEANATAQPKLHMAWRRSRESGTVASVPLRAQSTIVAILSFACDSAEGLAREKVARIETEAAPYAALIDVSALAARSLVRHASDDFGATKRRLFGSGRRAWITSVCLVLLVVWAVFGQLPYDSTVPCTVRASDRRTVSAPREGTLGEVFVRPGDHVRAGQLLAALDSHEDTLARIELDAQLLALDAQLDKALADRDSGQRRVLSADRQGVLARLVVVQQRIEQAQIRAPAAAIVLAGDLRSQIGARLQMGATLFELARYDQALVEIRVPERTILDARQTIGATFAAVASPERSYRLDELRFSPSSTVTDGQNVFLAEASTDASLDSLAPGMEGFARLDVGWRPVWWVLGRRVVHWLELNFWI